MFSLNRHLQWAKDIQISWVEGDSVSAFCLIVLVFLVLVRSLMAETVYRRVILVFVHQTT